MGAPAFLPLHPEPCNYYNHKVRQTDWPSDCPLAIIVVCLPLLFLLVGPNGSEWEEWPVELSLWMPSFNDAFNGITILLLLVSLPSSARLSSVPSDVRYCRCLSHGTGFCCGHSYSPVYEHPHCPFPQCDCRRQPTSAELSLGLM